MLVGHLGVGLAARAAAPRVGLGTLFAAAMRLDIVPWPATAAAIWAWTKGGGRILAIFVIVTVGAIADRPPQ